MADYSLAINANVSSGKEFKVYIGQDATVGAKNASSNGVTMYRMDIEGITLPTFSPNQEFEMRSGAGRIAEFGQLFSSSKRTVTEVSLSGRMTLQDLPILMENVFNQEVSTNLLEVATGYSPTPFKHGDSMSSATDWSKTLTIVFIAPTSADSYALKGCCCTNLSLSADLTSASGRYNYSATFQTQYLPEKGAHSVSSAKELTTTLGATNVFMSDQGSKDMNIMEVNSDGDDHTSINPLFSNITLTIDAPSLFLGSQGSDAEPEVIGRSVPEMTITVGGSVKYDTETDKLIEAFRDGGQDSYVQLILNNKGVTRNLETLGSIAIAGDNEQLFGFIVPKAKLTSAEVSSEDVSSVNFEMKVVDPEANKIIHIATGATA